MRCITWRLVAALVLLAGPADAAFPDRPARILVGFAAGEIPRIPLNLALLRERAIIGVFWGDAVRRDPRQHEKDMHRLAEWFAAGKVKPVISERVPLSGAAEAIARLAGRQAMGKIVVLPEQQ